MSHPNTQAICLYGTRDTDYQRQDSDLDIAVQLPVTAARSVERNQAQFYDVSYIEVKPHVHYPPDNEGQEILPPDRGGQGVSFPEKRAQGRAFPNNKGFLPYKSILTNKARQNRKKPTPAENKLWFDLLWGKRFSGLKFTRQKRLDDYIVDFYCAELMLAIEVDGDTHATRQQYDQLRTQRLKRLGVEVIRYTNADILHDLEGVGADLLRRVENRQPPKSPLSGGLALVAFESKREIIRVRNEDTGEIEEQWSGDYVFENEWQSFPTKKDRNLELRSVAHECPPGRWEIAVNVVDIFGNDTMNILEVIA